MYVCAYEMINCMYVESITLQYLYYDIVCMCMCMCMCAHKTTSILMIFLMI